MSLRLNGRDVAALHLNGREVAAARLNGRDVPLDVGPLEFDSFTTDVTVGPLPWWEAGGPTGTVQPRNVPYARGTAFKPTVDILLHGARFWTIIDPQGADSGGSTDQVPKLCLSNAIQWDAASHHVVFDDTQPLDASKWQTIMFDSPIPIAAGVEKLLWISTYTGTGARNVARSEGDLVGGATSVGGLLEALDPISWYGAPAIGTEFEAPLGTTTAWYWLDPLVTAV